MNQLFVVFMYKENKKEVMDMLKSIPTVFISKREFGFKSFAEEVEDILYGELPEKVEFNTIDEARAYQESLDKTKYTSYIANVSYNTFAK